VSSVSRTITIGFILSTASIAIGYAAAKTPVIHNVNILDVQQEPGNCWQLLVTVTGENIGNGAITANGVLLQNQELEGDTEETGILPQGFVSSPGKLSFVVTDYLTQAASAPFPYPASASPDIVLCPLPQAALVYTNTSFSIFVQPTAVNVTGNGEATLGSLPGGISGAATATLNANGALFQLKAAANAEKGSDSIVVNAKWAGFFAETATFPFTVSSGVPPSFRFYAPPSIEVGIHPGSSGQIQFSTWAAFVDYDIVPSIQGLPRGTTAAFSPAVIPAGAPVTVTLKAANDAEPAQNVTVTLAGKPSVDVPEKKINFLLDVSKPPGDLPGSRTDFVSTAGTPYAAVYDRTHNLIFASNPNWNRVDVISSASHKIVKSIPVRSPRGIDITQDNAHVWVQTGSQNLYEIDTSTMGAATYSLPNHTFGSGGVLAIDTSDRILALADGTLFLYYADQGGDDGVPDPQVSVWNPETNQLNVLSQVRESWGHPARSGDGKFVFASYEASPAAYPEMAEYSTATGRVTFLNSNDKSYSVVAVNGVGTRLVLSNQDTVAQVFDRDLKRLGDLPLLSYSGYTVTQQSGVVFSADDSKLYLLGADGNLPVVYTLDAVTLKILATAPASPTFPSVYTGNFSESVAAPFAVDSTGMLLGIQDYGISFDDAMFAQHYAAVNPPGFNGTEMYQNTFGGPLTGGTTSTFPIFTSGGYCPVFIPDAWIGSARAKSSLNPYCGGIKFTSAPGKTPGPANVKFIYPDGDQWFFPLLFTYSTFPEYAVISGSAPQGGAAASLIGYGLPQDTSSGTVRVDDHDATITTPKKPYPPFSGEPYPSTVLNYTLPSGAPGWKDLTVTSANGTGVLSKSIFYAKGVTEYASPDSLTAVLLDAKRDQLYLSAGDHINVFSLSSKSFTESLHPAAQSPLRLFTGMALTPDGSKLLVADLLDNSIAVIDPDRPTSTFAIRLGAPSAQHGASCPSGPLFVAAAADGLAFVTKGSEPNLTNGCDSSGDAYVVNLQKRTATLPSAYSNCLSGGAGSTAGFGVDATNNGENVVTGPTYWGNACVYSALNSTYTSLFTPNTEGIGISFGYGVSVSGDGNVIGSNFSFFDLESNLLGAIALPFPYYGTDIGYDENWTPSPYPSPRLNASGSLYYFAYPNYFEIVDVAHAVLRIRFALTQTVKDVGTPMAIDSGGRFVYLITSKGLTVVDLGAAPLSIGHLSLISASPGTDVQIRGSGFVSGMTATIGGIAAEVQVTDQNTLTLTIPVVASGPQDIVLSIAGGETYTLENGITVF
jgi:sugar lactone lactonase YvrE